MHGPENGVRVAETMEESNHMEAATAGAGGPGRDTREGGGATAGGNEREAADAENGREALGQRGLQPLVGAPQEFFRCFARLEKQHFLADLRKMMPSVRVPFIWRGCMARIRGTSWASISGHEGILYRRSDEMSR